MSFLLKMILNLDFQFSYLCNMYIIRVVVTTWLSILLISTVHTYIKLQTPSPLPGNSPLFTSAICHCQGFLEWFFCLCLLQMLKKGKIDLDIPLLKFQFPFLNFFYYTYYQITFSIIFFKVASKGAKLCKVALGMLNDRGNSTTSPCLVWLIVKLTLRDGLGYFFFWPSVLTGVFGPNWAFAKSSTTK